MTFMETLRAARPRLPLDAKRKPSQSGIESWHPYYAGYTEDFARGVLAILSSGEPLTVLDPWNGSGTTSSIAREFGHTSLGFDLNPVANLVASAKVVNPDDAFHVTGLAKRMAESDRASIADDDPLLSWMARSVVAQFRSIESKILAELATSPDGIIERPATGGLPPLAAFMLLALIRAGREWASVAKGSNPTWNKPADGRKKLTRTLGKRWIEKLNEMAADLQGSIGTSVKRTWAGRISLGDARKLPVEDARVDVVVTSPPYCTRIDYVVSNSYELAALGIGSESPEFLALRRASMGTPLARRGEVPDAHSHWPPSVKSLLGSIRTHKSKASSSYYYKTYHQYFADAEASLKELSRVLKPSGIAVLVVQTSYYKEICVDLPSLYVDMAEAVGLRGEIAGQKPVHRAMAQINPHALHHRKVSQYREAVVVMEKTA